MRSEAGLARRRKWARDWYIRNYKGHDGKALYQAIKCRGQQRMAEFLTIGKVNELPLAVLIETDNEMGHRTLNVVSIDRRAHV